jgi:hypothetical protein
MQGDWPHTMRLASQSTAKRNGEEYVSFQCEILRWRYLDYDGGVRMVETLIRDESCAAVVCFDWTVHGDLFEIGTQIVMEKIDGSHCYTPVVVRARPPAPDEENRTYSYDVQPYRHQLDRSRQAYAWRNPEWQRGKAQPAVSVGLSALLERLSTEKEVQKSKARLTRHSNAQEQEKSPPSSPLELFELVARQKAPLG